MEGRSVEVFIDMSEIDEAIRKTERLNQLLKEANSLVNELASKRVTVTASIAEFKS